MTLTKSFTKLGELDECDMQLAWENEKCIKHFNRKIWRQETS
jgi:hypothetical protein